MGGCHGLGRCLVGVTVVCCEVIVPYNCQLHVISDKEWLTNRPCVDTICQISQPSPPEPNQYEEMLLSILLLLQLPIATDAYSYSIQRCGSSSASRSSSYHRASCPPPPISFVNHHTHHTAHHRLVAPLKSTTSPSQQTSPLDSINDRDTHRHRADEEDEHTTAAVLLQTILTGKHKWLGGSVDANGDGSVYGIPSHSRHVICLSPPKTADVDGEVVVDVDDSSSYQVHMLPLPSSVAPRSNSNKDHQFKFLRGIITNSTLFGIPSWSKEGVLVVDIAAWSEWRRDHPGEWIVGDEEAAVKFVSVLPLPNESTDGGVGGDDSLASNHRWMWHGAALNRNATAIYCIPSNAKQVLKVDLVSLATSYLDVPAPKSDNGNELLQYSNKWYGGILGNDNAIYGMPYAAGSVLRIDANDDSVSLLGEFGWNKYNWHGGVKAPSNGAIYAFPAHSETVLRIDTSEGMDDESRLTKLPIHRAPYDVHPITRYKWLGGSLGADGNVYGMPSDASSVLRVNVDDEIVTTFGWVERTDIRDGNGHDKIDLENRFFEKNKFQGGVLGRDGFVYAIPSNARGVLRIDTRPIRDDEVASSSGIQFLGKERVSCIGDLPDTKDKWQGGFAVGSGAIYGIPENCNQILKVLPPLASNADDREGDGTDTNTMFDGVLIRTL
jgi:hypothetical protein